MFGLRSLPPQRADPITEDYSLVAGYSGLTWGNGGGYKRGPFGRRGLAGGPWTGCVV